VDVLGDGNCGLQVVAEHVGVGEDSRYVIFLKDGCRIPPSYTKWKLHKKEEAEI